MKLKKGLFSRVFQVTNSEELEIDPVHVTNSGELDIDSAHVSPIIAQGSSDKREPLVREASGRHNPRKEAVQ